MGETERTPTGRGAPAADAGWTLVLSLLLVALVPTIGGAEPQAGTALIHSISVDAASNASYLLLIDSTIVEAEKQGEPCEGFSRDDEVSVFYDEATIVLISGENTCRLIVRGFR